MILKIVTTVGEIKNVEYLECALVSVNSVGTRKRVLATERLGGIQHEVLVFDTAENTNERKTEYEIIN
jgi:hypothetical protein